MPDIPKENKNTATINGIIKKTVFQNTENGFTILNIYSNGKFITASGTFFDKPIQDSKIKLKGEFIHHKKYGYQFNFTQYEVSLANTKTAIIDYLSSSIFKGIGKVIAAQIYERFKEKTLDIIDNEPEKLKEVAGIGRVKLAVIIEGLKESYGLRKAVMFFKPYQFSDYQIKSIYNQFKDKSIAMAKENPYIFTEIKGIGFKKADIMAEKLGIEKNDPNRIKEAIKYIIANYCENSGNCFAYYRDVKNGIKDIIGDTEPVNEKDLKKYISDLIQDKKLIADEGNVSHAASGGETMAATPDGHESIDGKDKSNRIKIYLPVYYYCEIGISKELKRIAGNMKNIEYNDAKECPKEKKIYKDMETYLTKTKDSTTLTDEQKLAVYNALNYKISIISGGPGTGKSTIIKTIVGLCKGKKTALTSLSGKASQRLADIVKSKSSKYPGENALNPLNENSCENGGNNRDNFNGGNNTGSNNIDISTIHRLLKAQFDRTTNESFFAYNENNKLPHDLIIIDEMSMADIIIFFKLLKAVKGDAVLVLVGDVNQIPSVSPGDVLRDLISARELFPTVFLTKVFRQNEGGLINLNAHNLLNNKKFITINKESAGNKTRSLPEGESFTIKYRKEYDAANSGKEELLKDFTGFIKKIAQKRLSRLKGLNKQDANAYIFDDIQVLTPMRKGSLGYNNLNGILQEIFNPGVKSPSIEYAECNINEMQKNRICENAGAGSGNSAEQPFNDANIFICNGIKFKLYDRIIQKKNNYDLDVFNGDTGYITRIDHDEKTLSADFSGYFKNKESENYDIDCNGVKKTVTYDFIDVYENIMPAYALSIHKAQGSEFNNVIILFHQSHFMMLKKNLLYTAITRGKKNVVIFGTFKAFGIAMNSKEEIRNSGLKKRLAEEFGKIYSVNGEGSK